MPMRFLRPKLLAIILWIAFAPFAFAASQPIDADTGQRLDDVWRVATRWECVGWAHCSDLCVELIVDKGELGRLSWLRSASQYRVEYYRTGFYEVSGQGEEPRLSRTPPSRFSGRSDTIGARIGYLRTLAAGAICYGPAEKDLSRLAGFFQDLLREGASIAQLPEHKRDLRSSLCNNLLIAAGKSELPEICTEKLDWRERDQMMEAIRTRDRSALEATLDGPLRAEKVALRLNPALVTSVDRGDFAGAQLLLQAKADPNFQSRDLEFRLMLSALATKPPKGAISTGLLNMHPIEPPEGRVTAAHRAVSGISIANVNGQIAAQQLNSKAAPQSPELPAGPLQLAQALLDAGADPNRFGTNGLAPIHEATAASNGEMLALFLLHGGNPNLPGTEDGTSGIRPLHVANDAAVARLLIDAGAEIDAKDSMGRTALAITSNTPTAVLLLEHGANPNETFANGWTPLMSCLQHYEMSRNRPEVASGYRDFARALVLHGADLARRNGDGNNALYFTTDQDIKEELSQLAARRNRPQNP